jgi:hypothetical protein
VAFNASSFIGSVENLVSKNNTTTSSYDISSGLVSRVVTFHKGTKDMYARIPIPKTLYPAVIVEMNGKEEEFSMLGNNKRQINVNFSVVSIIDYGAGTTTEATNARETSNLEAVKLSQNIEALIRAYPRLSQTSLVMKTDIVSTEYSVIAKDDSTYNSIAKTNCIAQCLSI